MLERIYHWLSGYVEFRVDGDGARLFTMAARSGLGLWGFRREDGKPVARARPGVYRKLRPLCRRCGAVGRITRKRGLPFQSMRLWRRKGLLLGAVLGAALYWYISGFLWGVSVSGTEKVLPLQVLRAAEEGGVFVGAGRVKARAGGPENRIQALIPELSWVSVNMDGCYAEVVVKEGEAKPQLQQDGELSNIVASREGQIVAMEAMEGRPQVRLGDTVSQGDVLIAGVFQEEPDPWSAQPPEPYSRAGAARGSVTAETFREFTVQVGSTLSEPVEEGESTSVWLEVFGLRMPLGLWDRYEGDCRVWSQRRQVQVLGVELPLSVERQTTVRLSERERELSEEEMKQAALRKLREAQQAQLPPGSSVRKEELEYSFADGMCILSARCRCWEEIGVKEIIMVG